MKYAPRQRKLMATVLWVILCAISTGGLIPQSDDKKCPDGSKKDPVLGCRQSTREIPSGNRSEDIQTQIQNALKNDPTLGNDNLNVMVNDKAVELTGNVASKQEKENAKKIAEQYAGKLKVKDKIKVEKGSSNPGNNPSGTSPSSNPGGKPPGNGFMPQSSSSSGTQQQTP